MLRLFEIVKFKVAVNLCSSVGPSVVFTVTLSVARNNKKIW